MIDLGLLATSHNYSQALRINDLGQVVGVSAVQESNGYVDKDQPFLYSAGNLANIGSLGGGYGLAQAINDSGQIVGISANANGITDAFLDTNGTFIDLGHFPSSYQYSTAYGINGSGTIVGYSTTASGPGYEHAFAYSDGSMTDLGTLGGNNSRAFDVNASGQVVGASFVADNSVQHAFLDSGGTMQDLGALNAVNSFGLGINDTGAVVGTLTFGAGQNNHGFLYQNGTMIDLNDLLSAGSGWVLRDAQGINDRGQIVGQGLYNGEIRAYLLTPVPEPSSLWIWLIGLAAVVSAQCRSRMRSFIDAAIA